MPQLSRFKPAEGYKNPLRSTRSKRIVNDVGYVMLIIDEKLGQGLRRRPRCQQFLLMLLQQSIWELKGHHIPKGKIKWAVKFLKKHRGIEEYWEEVLK